ncbi:MAG: FAD-dependent oxidoreductase, partial [Tangfeifania sp.]
MEVSQSGKSVIVVSPDKHPGGLTAGGLGWTDTGNKAAIGGLSREFYHNVWQHYNQPEAWKWQEKSEYGNRGQGTPAIDGENRTMWIFELHVAEQVFEDFIAENEITVYRNEWLKREVPWPVGMGSYPMDSHNVQRYITPDGFVQNEGDIGVSPPAPYSISYGSIVPT